MSKQREVLPKVLAMVIAQVPDAAIYLSGSVALGNERPDSDLDIYAVVPDIKGVHYPGGTMGGEREGYKSFAAEYEGVPLEVRFMTPSFFEGHLHGKPWRGYKTPLKSEILSDPNGFLQSWKDRLAPWFRDHPEAVALWEQWITEYTDCRCTKGKKQGKLIQQFPYAVPHFWPYLDGLYSGEVIPE
ncbi:MAG: nucleotidyltransferase domain-containing protein [Candidatus Hydrogenedentes bacterium]|nr:nucleotidyltransferase domain-containing protein [Candidatus Hydrogenedentota bacterium]